MPKFSSHAMARLRWGMACLLLACLMLPTLSRAEAVNDVRVLIDVSGSMKHNDPNNLRAPALRLLVGLMPEGARSGVWTFGKYVNLQVPLDTINQTWKDQAMQEAGNIHSRGLFTNIEEAVQRASADWEQPDPQTRRHLILLTDGVVDIDKDAKLNEQSRRRLLHDILPRLERADATVHTIALSHNADSELLSALSGATGGAFEQVDSADQLQRIFLRLFEKSVAPDTLPLEDNKFTVDKHVSDFTVLVFLAKDSPPTVLQSPTGEKWSQDTHPDAVKWHHEAGYDLITVRDPAAGEWRLQAKVDPDNRVMVVTNMRLKADKLPNTLLTGDSYTVHARLLEEGKTITNENLLQRTRFELKQIDASQKVKSLELADDGVAADVLKGDGVYSNRVDALEQAGNFELVVQARSLTFNRELRHTLTVYDSPATIAITRAAQDQPFKISVRPHAGLIRPETVSMQIRLPEGEPQIIRQVDDLVWEVDADNKFADQKFTLTLVGTRYNDKAIKMEFEQVLSVTGEAQALLPATAPPPSQAPAPAVETARPEEPQEDAAVGEAEQSGFSWTIVIILVVVANLLVIGGGWFAYRIWKKRQDKEQQEVEAELQV